MYDKSMSIKLVIFDLDGTLVDSLADITTSVNYAIRPLGYEKLTPEEIKRHVGSGITRAILGILKDGDKGLLEDVVDRFVEYYSDHIADETTIYPGVSDVLTRLDGIKKGVISNKRELLVKRALHELGLAHHFDIIYGSDSAEDKKPSPAPINKMLASLGVSPAEALIVGDSDVDIGAGRAAGIKTVGVTYGYRSRESLNGADALIDHMADLPGLIETFNS